jgi:hypothetical protein
VCICEVPDCGVADSGVAGGGIRTGQERGGEVSRFFEGSGKSPGLALLFTTIAMTIQ